MRRFNDNNGGKAESTELVVCIVFSVVECRGLRGHLGRRVMGCCQELIGLVSFVVVSLEGHGDLDHLDPPSPALW